MIALRSYQEQIIAGSLEVWREHRRIAAVLGTGGGKTVIFSHIAKLARQAGRPTLVVAHRTELIEQAADKLRQINPGARVGIFKGPRKEYRAEIVVASVQTASTPTGLALLRTAGFGLIIIDETHHVVADTYMRVLRELGAYDVRPDAPLVLGVTATLDRTDGVALGQVFETIVEPTIGLRELIRDGWLVPPRGVRVKIADLDLGTVRQKAGDFDQARLAAAMHDALAPAAIARAYLEHAKGRPAIAFLPTVQFSVEQAAAFEEHGVRAVHLDGATPAPLRAATIERHRAGDIDVLCNVGLFTEGTDLPHVSCIILGRPTKSASLYTQMVGRGVRLAPGKRDCIILDVVGVTGKHRLATLANLDGADREEDLDDDLALYEAEYSEDEIEAPAPKLEIPPEDVPIVGADGPLDHELIDLFGSAHAAWLRTVGGVWFIAAGPDYFVYLVPTAGDRYEVTVRAKRSGAAGVPLLGTGPLEIGYAMAWGEEYIESVPMWGLGRDAKWRTLKPTAKLIARARAVGVPVSRFSPLNRGELHDLVSVAEASALLD